MLNFGNQAFEVFTSHVLALSECNCIQSFLPTAPVRHARGKQLIEVFAMIQVLHVTQLVHYYVLNAQQGRLHERRIE